MTTQTKDPYASRGCYVEECFEKGYRPNPHDPYDTGVPEVSPTARWPQTSLLAQIFGLPEQNAEPAKLSD